MTKPDDERPVGRVEQGDGAVQGGEHAAPVDVADEDGRHAGRPGQPQVDDVARRAG